MTKARDLANAADVLDDVSATELSYVNGVTSAIQTQLDSKASTTADIPKSLIDAKGDLIVGSAADTAARLAVGTNDYVLTADSSATNGVKWAAPAGGGKVLQVVSANTTTFTNITSTSLTDTTITATITPTASNSKVLVIISANQLTYWTSTNTYCQSKSALLRGSTAIATYDNPHQVEGASATYGSTLVQASYHYLDSPATTSSTTYKLQAAKVVGNGVAFQNSSSPSVITLLEIGA